MHIFLLGTDVYLVTYPIAENIRKALLVIVLLGYLQARIGHAGPVPLCIAYGFLKAR
jgi:hypothetical protein